MAMAKTDVILYNSTTGTQYNRPQQRRRHFQLHILVLGSGKVASAVMQKRFLKGA